MPSARVCAIALSFFAVAQATLVINSVNVVGNGTSTVSFSSTDPDNDPTTVTIELANPAFHSQFGVGNNVVVANGKFTFETPQILPGDGYSIQLVNNSDVNDILAQSPTFAVTENDVKSSTTSGSSATVSSGASSSLPTTNSPALTSPSSSQTNSPQSGASSSGSPSFSAPPSTSSNAVFGNGGGGNGATGLRASLALGIVGVAFAFL